MFWYTHLLPVALVFGAIGYLTYQHTQQHQQYYDDHPDENDNTSTHRDDEAREDRNPNATPNNIPIAQPVNPSNSNDATTTHHTDERKYVDDEVDHEGGSIHSTDTDIDIDDEQIFHQLHHRNTIHNAATSSSSSSSSSAAAHDLCALCEEHEVNTIMIPCMHLKICHHCSVKLEQNLNDINSMKSFLQSKEVLRCPFCVTPVQSMHKVYR